MHAFKSYNSFPEMVKDLTMVSSAIEELITDSRGDLPISSDEATLTLLGRLADNLPTVFSPAYPASAAITVSATETSYKTPGQLSFGWRTTFNKESEQVQYNARITVAAHPCIAAKTAEMIKAGELGFVIKDNYERRSK